MKFVDIGRNTSGEGDSPGQITDAEARKRGKQTGLDTLVVHAVNDDVLGVSGIDSRGAEANALSHPAWEVRPQG